MNTVQFLLLAIVAMLFIVFLSVSQDNQAEECMDYDNGLDLQTQSHVDSMPWRYPDTCVSEQQLSEYYCKNGQVGRDIITCPLGCNDGVCVDTIQEEVLQDTHLNASVSPNFLSTLQSFGTVNNTPYHCYNLDYTGDVFKREQMQHFVGAEEISKPSKVILASPRTGNVLSEQKDTCTTFAGEPAIIEYYCGQSYDADRGITALALSKIETCDCVSTQDGDYCQ